MIELFVIRDNVSGTTQAPFNMQTKRDAIQGFRELVNDSKTTIHKHPDDFVLYSLGVYDPRSMSFDLLQDPKRLHVARELLNEQ